MTAHHAAMLAEGIKDLALQADPLSDVGEGKDTEALLRAATVDLIIHADTAQDRL